MLLPNGVNVITTPIPDTPLVRVDFLFLGAQWLQNHPLQARFAFSQLKEGTGRYNGDTLAETLDYYGATVTTSCSLSYASVTLHCLQKFLEPVYDIVLSMMTEPLYEQKKLDLALSQGRTTWQIQHQKVDTLCKEELYRRLYGSQHPMGQFPTLTDYDTLTPDLLHAYHQAHIRSSYKAVLVTGNVEELKELEEIMDVKETNSLSSKNLQSTEEHHVCLESGLPRVQAAVRLGCLLPTPAHPDMPLLRLVVTLLGGYFGSRLMSNIREKRGYTYGINATLYNVPHNNALVIACETATKYAEAVVSETRRELQRLCEEPVGEDELQMVKNYMEGQYCRRYERSFNYPQVLMNLIATGRTPDNVAAEQHLQQQAISDDVLRIARQYLRPERFIDCVVV